MINYTVDFSLITRQEFSDWLRYTVLPEDYYHRKYCYERESIISMPSEFNSPNYSPQNQTNGHWVTLSDGRHVLIGDGADKPKKNLNPKITTQYGQIDEWHPDNGHGGIDIGNLPNGTPIPAARGGNVIRSGAENRNNLSQGFGYRVIIDSGDGYSQIYGHMKYMPDISVGNKVSQGDVIGYVGSTGHSSGNHLHYEVRNAKGNSVAPSNNDVNYLLDFFKNL